METTKAVVSIADMARIVGLSRAGSTGCGLDLPVALLAVQ